MDWCLVAAGIGIWVSALKCRRHGNFFIVWRKESSFDSIYRGCIHLFSLRNHALCSSYKGSFWNLGTRYSNGRKKYIICTRISFLRHVASKSEIGTTSNQNTLAQDTRNFFKDAVGTNLSVAHPQPMAWGEAKPKRQIDV